MNDPDRPVSRSEFLAAGAEMAGLIERLGEQLVRDEVLIERLEARVEHLEARLGREPTVVVPGGIRIDPL